MELKPRSKGGIIYVHFEGPDGRRMRLSTGTTDPTMAQLKGLEIMREHLVDVLPEDARELGNLTTLGDMLRDTWQRRWRHLNSAKDLRKRVAKIVRLIGHWPRSKVSYERVEDWLNELTTGKHNPKPISPATRNRYVTCIHTAFVEARKRDSSVVIPELPSWPENNMKERYVTTDEERRILAWFAEHTAAVDTQRIYLRDLFVLLIDTGMRASEALEEMRQESLIPFQGDRLGVHLRHGCTKSGKGRVVPLTPRALLAARSMIASRHHGQTSSNNAGRQFRNVMEKVGIEGVTLHILRHTTASRLVQARVSLYEVSIWLGHSSMEVTRRYAHLAPDSLSGALAALEGTAQADAPTACGVYPLQEAHPVHSGTEKRTFLRVIK